MTVGLVTGAARGMGMACARRIAPTVDVLFLVDLEADGVDTVAADLATVTRSVPVALDVTDPGAVGALGDAITEAGPLRRVVHAAGMSPTMGDWKTIVTVDLVGSALLVEMLTPLVVPGTAMVCFASIAAAIGGVGPDVATDAVLDDPLGDDFLRRLRATAGESVESLAYSYAKRGVVRLVERTATVWGPLGGRINSISPGLIDTPMGRQELEQQPLMATMLEMTPLRRLGAADEEAAVVSFLLSEEASFVTGADVTVDGGLVAAMRNAPPLQL